MPQITTTTTTTRTSLPQQPAISKEREMEILKKIENYCNHWSIIANLYNAGIIVLGIAAITTSVLVSIYTGSNLIKPDTLKILACVSTISLALLTAFNLVDHSNDARNAWRAMNASLMLYKAGNLDIVKLIEQYLKGEKQMGFINFNYGPNGSQTDNHGAETITKTIQTKSGEDQNVDADLDTEIVGDEAKTAQEIEQKNAKEVITNGVVLATASTIETNGKPETIGGRDAEK